MLTTGNQSAISLMVKGFNEVLTLSLEWWFELVAMAALRYATGHLVLRNVVVERMLALRLMCVDNDYSVPIVAVHRNW